VKHYGYLLLAILTEVIATTALKSSNGFTRFMPSFVVVVGYVSASYFFSLCLQAIAVGVAYAIWSGLGIILVTLLSWWVHKQQVDLFGMIGIGMIIAGVVMLNLFSQSVIRE